MSVIISSVSLVPFNPVVAELIEPIAERSAAGETPAAPIGTGQKAVITTPESSSVNPVALNITDNVSDGSVEIAAATEGANVYVIGNQEADNAARILIGLGENDDEKILSNAGSTVQVAEYYKGEIIVNYDDAIPAPGVKVDLNTQTVGNSTSESLDTSEGTIADNAPSNLTTEQLPDFYIQTGAANDKIQGSAANDFIRGGAGSDLINAGDGNDIVRGGAGSDKTTLGAGEDVYYLTVDQLQGTSTDTITDFTNGEDQVQLDANIADRVSISGFGTQSLVISLSGPETGTTTVVASNGTEFQENDVAFV